MPGPRQDVQMAVAIQIRRRKRVDVAALMEGCERVSLVSERERRARPKRSVTLAWEDRDGGESIKHSARVLGMRKVTRRHVDVSITVEIAGYEPGRPVV